MNSLIRYEPFKELMSLREAMDRLFEDSFVTPSLFRGVRSAIMVPSASRSLRLKPFIYQPPD